MRFKIAIAILSLMTTLSAWGACNDLSALLNQVTFRLNAEQWVPTKTALVNVNIDASVNAKQLATIQNDVLQQLNNLSTAEWHIVQFNRSLDQSGLERIQISAQARLSSDELSNLRDKAKSLSKPGETFTLADIQFTPSEDDLRAANSALRANIYQQAKDEVARVNKVYPEQKYTLHQIDFLSEILPVAMAANTFMQKQASAGGIAVGNKLTLSATVTLAALPEQCLINPAH